MTPSVPVIEEKPLLSLDGILDKINKVGVDSLSEEEKAFLRNF